MYSPNPNHHEDDGPDSSGIKQNAFQPLDPNVHSVCQRSNCGFNHRSRRQDKVYKQQSNVAYVELLREANTSGVRPRANV